MRALTQCGKPLIILLPHRGRFVTVKKYFKTKNVQKHVWRYILIFVDLKKILFFLMECAKLDFSCLFCVRKVALLHMACAKVAHAQINLLSRTPCACKRATSRTQNKQQG